MKAIIKSQPTVFVIFGATGDLTWRKLAPALYNLFLDNWLPEQFSIIGTARTEMTDDEFRHKLLDGICQFSRSGEADAVAWAQFSQRIFYQMAEFDAPHAYQALSARLMGHAGEWQREPNVIYYLAVGPSIFPVITQNLADHRLAADPSKTRIVIEKPFGHDLASANGLNKLLQGLFDERQIYRIDHYLGKETVQNILAFRFANAILEPLWNRNYIEHVQISVTEALSVGERGGYYDGSGALRDMVQNHVLQLLCLIAMEPPVAFTAEEVRNNKANVLRAMRRFTPEMVRDSAVRGQYGRGWAQGNEVAGYREETDVMTDSNTETFAAVKFFVDNWRWQGVPFYVRTGKRLHQSASVITIQFKDVPHPVFPFDAAESRHQNRLIISIQPEMSIRLQVQAKRPGVDLIINTVDMVFDYQGTYTTATPEAYETLLLDTMLGDQTLFMRGDQVEAAWELIMPILTAWKAKKSQHFPNYSADSWGPEGAEALLAHDGFHWFMLPPTVKNSDHRLQMQRAYATLTHPNEPDRA